MTHIETVAEHLCVTENTTETHDNPTSLILFGYSEMLTVPSDGVLRVFPSHLFISVRVACLATIRKVNNPVVRQVDMLPQ